MGQDHLRSMTVKQFSRVDITDHGN